MKSNLANIPKNYPRTFLKHGDLYVNFNVNMATQV